MSTSFDIRTNPLPERERAGASLTRLLSDVVPLKRRGLRCSTALVVRLIKAVFSCLQDASSAAELLVHIPKAIYNAAAGELSADRRIIPDHFNLISGGSRKARVRDLGADPDGRLTGGDLLIILVCSPHGLMISFHPEPGGEEWVGMIGSRPKPVAAGCRAIRTLAGTETGEVLGWLDRAAASLERGTQAGDPCQGWNDALIDILSDVENLGRARAEELERIRTLNRIHEAAGWELDQGRFYNAVEHALKESVGYHYLEMQMLQSVKGKWEVASSFHKNETDYGGPLLTLILKPPRRDEILSRGKAVFVDENSAKDVFANPKLVSLMMLKSGVIVPLIDRGKPNGLLKMFSCEEGRYREADARLFQQIGAVLARSSENVRKYNLIRRMATVDALTNIYNRRFFSEQMAREFNRAHRYGSNLSLLMIDIDNFKHYNDANGHLSGDKVLANVAGILKSNMRESDLVARYGGEEFTVILPETDLAQGKVVAEKIRSSIEQFDFEHGEKQPLGRLTISLGLATKTSEMKEATDLINCADIALYRAKKAGRNRCVAYNDN